MNEFPKVSEHLKELAQNYHDTHQAFQERHRETTSAEEFLAEVNQREAALMNRFRLLQQQLLATLEEKDLERMLELSRIIDEMRIINQFAVQTLVGAGAPADNQVAE